MSQPVIEKSCDSRVKTEMRCWRCGRLLMKYDACGSMSVEVKCPRCQQLNYMQTHTLSGAVL
jgi:phage FluMu protein Com